MRRSTKARLSDGRLHPRTNHTHVSMPVRERSWNRGSRVGRLQGRMLMQVGGVELSQSLQLFPVENLKIRTIDL
jgi:hypothetical protein